MAPARARRLSLEARLLISLAAALAVVHLTTPLAIKVAQRFEFFDRPVGYKGHATPTPYLGGAAVVAGFAIVVLLLAGEWDRTLPLLGGVAILWFVGTVDDRRTVSPFVRVTVELALGIGLWALGLGWSLGAGPVVDLAVSALWIVAVVNAFNLFDNMDGAAASMTAVVAAGLAFLGVVEGNTWLAVTAAALAGAAIGFLPHNLFASPARIFLGDGGSMPLGFAVAAVAMIGVSEAAAAWQSLAMGLLFVGIPALDTTLVMVSRRRRGLSVLTAGRDHLTHRAHARLHTARAVAVTLGGAQAVISALAVVALRGSSAGIVIAVVAYLVGLGVAITLLDTRFSQDAAPVTTATATATHAPRPTGDLAALVLLVPLAAVLAASPFFFGYYDAGQWVPAGLVLLGVATAGLIARPPRLTAPAVLLLTGLAGLGAWALASSLWADSIEQAVVQGNRWLAYAALALVLLVLVRSERTALALLAALAVGALVVGMVVVVRMLGSDPADLFLGGRLNAPLGYINGLAAFFLLGAWLCLAAAERREALVAGAGAAGASLLSGLALLSQSRGVAVAALASVVVVLAVAPGRARRGWAMIAIAGATALAAPALFDIYEQGATTPLPAEIGNRAARHLLLAAAGAGLLWGLATWIAARAPRPERLRRVAGGVLVAVAMAGAVVGLASAGRIADEVDRQYTAFVRLSVEPQGSSVGAVPATRLVSGAGNRYDYWRIAWNAWRDAPVRGVGAGNYDRPYFAQRTTAEDIRQPHSIELQLLSELGLVGALLLASLLAGLALGAARLALAARGSAGARTVLVASLGMVTAWLVHTSVDWIHLLPGVTGVALVGAVCLVRRARTRGGAARTHPGQGTLAAGGRHRARHHADRRQPEPAGARRALPRPGSSLAGDRSGGGARVGRPGAAARPRGGRRVLHEGRSARALQRGRGGARPRCARPRAASRATS